jgi:hypothetical protein
METALPSTVDRGKKPKPSLHIDMEDVERLGDAEFGDTLELRLRVKVASISQDEYHPSTQLRLDVLRASLIEKDTRAGRKG